MKKKTVKDLLYEILDLEQDSEKDKKNKSKRKKIIHKVQNKILEISVTINKLTEIYEMDEDEYETSAIDLESILDLFDINSKKLLDPKTTVNNFKLTVKTTIENANFNNNTISLFLHLNTDQTIAASVIINGKEKVFDDLTKVISFFNEQYKSFIRDTINKELEAKEEE